MENRGRISATLTNKQSLGGKVKLKMLKGEDGFSPTISTTSTSKGTTVTVTDAEGDHSFIVLNGENGDPGYDTRAGTGTGDTGRRSSY